jgi:hypothetical protein
VELERAIVVLRVPTVEREDVEVRVHRERLREPPHEHHRPTLHRAAEASALTAEDRLHEKPRHRRQHVLARRQKTHQLGRRRQHVLANRDLREHALHQVGRDVVHPPRAAARAQTSVLARERHRPLDVAVRAPKGRDYRRLIARARQALPAAWRSRHTPEVTSDPRRYAPAVQRRLRDRGGGRRGAEADQHTQLADLSSAMIARRVVPWKRRPLRGFEWSDVALSLRP